MATKTVKGRPTASGKVSIRRRIWIVFGLLAAMLLALVLKLFYLQTIDADDQYAAQVDQLVDEVYTTGQRGNIYDRNMNVLVQDSSAKSVNLIPNDVEDARAVSRVLADSLGLKYEDVYKIATRLEDDKVEIKTSVRRATAEKLLADLGDDDAYAFENGSIYCRPANVKNVDRDAAVIASTFEMDEDDVKAYLTQKENSLQLVKSKVDNALAESIQQKETTYDEDGKAVSTNGVELIEDKKRYYTNGNFAAYVLGFTSRDHEGLYGVEKTFNDTLRGQDGIVQYQKDARGNTIVSQTKVVQEAKPGEDLVLSIDSTIQSAAEKALQSAVTQWKAKSGTAVVMDTKTGEIIAMATKPDYNLNDPYAVSDAFKASHGEYFQKASEDEQIQEMWKNPAVSFIYEPGSTFKPVTVAAALEEGAIDPSMSFTCTGAYNVSGTTIHCTGIHGTQNISQVLENSCNPGLIQIIQDVDPNTFYKYVYNFGFGKRTGIELTGEESGIVNRVFDSEGNIKMVDYSTFSFGQGEATTPIQILSALNALINGGHYVKPTIVKGGGTESPSQIISEATSAEMRKDMEAVVTSHTNLAEQAEGFSIGGKTGTAEKFIDGEYSSTKYVTSFFCFAPVDDPKYAMLLVLDEPSSEAFGGTSAAPAAIEVMKQTLIYAGSNPQQGAGTQVLVPDCVGQSLEDAESVLEERGITYKITQSGEGNTVLSQSIPAKTVYSAGTELNLSVGDKPASGEKTVPDFTGMSVQAVNEAVKAIGMKLEIQGSGFARSQSVAPGSPAVEGQAITVVFSE